MKLLNDNNFHEFSSVLFTIVLMYLQDSDIPEVGMTRLIRVNAPEWLFIMIGCVAALVNGGIMPAFAVIFSEIIGVSVVLQVCFFSRT